VVLGDPDSDELYALKRVSFGSQTSFTLTFQCPNPDLQEAVLYLVCDSYLGMDQQLRIPMPGYAGPPQVCAYLNCWLLTREGDHLALPFAVLRKRMTFSFCPLPGYGCIAQLPCAGKRWAPSALISAFCPSMHP